MKCRALLAPFFIRPALLLRQPTHAGCRLRLIAEYYASRHNNFKKENCSNALQSIRPPGIMKYLYGYAAIPRSSAEREVFHMTAKTKESLAIASRVCVALAIFLLIVFNYDRLTHLDMRELVELAPNFASAVAALLGVYLLKSVLFVIPASLIYISIGMAFDWPTACLINMAGILLEVFASYLLGRFLGGNRVEELLRKKKGGAKLLNLNLQDKPGFIFLIRLVPAFPIDFTSLFFGAFTKPRLFPLYLLMSLLGLAPRVIAFTIVGDQIYDYLPMRFIITACMIAIPVGVVISLIRRKVQKKKSEQ